MTIVKQAVFSIAFAVAAVAIAEFTAWLLEGRLMGSRLSAYSRFDNPCSRWRASRRSEDETDKRHPTNRPFCLTA